jgi:lysine/ornithine N-monooxygenase
VIERAREPGRVPGPQIPTEFWRQATSSSSSCDQSEVVIPRQLTETIYDFLYDQSILNADPRTWQFQVRYRTEVDRCYAGSENKVVLSYREHRHGSVNATVNDTEYDLVIAATGYHKHEHERILNPLRELLDGPQGRISVGLDSQVNFRSGVKRKDTGIWLLQPLANTSDVSPPGYLCQQRD